MRSMPLLSVAALRALTVRDAHLQRGGTKKTSVFAMSLLILAILDVNGEYTNLTRRANGESSQYDGKIAVLTPRLSLRFTLTEAGLGTMLDILLHALDLPGTSARVFARIWRQLEAANDLTLKSLGEAISNSDCHESVRDALQSRYNTLLDAGLFTDDISVGGSRHLLDHLAAAHGRNAIASSEPTTIPPSLYHFRSSLVLLASRDRLNKSTRANTVAKDPIDKPANPLRMRWLNIAVAKDAAPTRLEIARSKDLFLPYRTAVVLTRRDLSKPACATS